MIIVNCQRRHGPLTIQTVLLIINAEINSGKHSENTTGAVSLGRSRRGSRVFSRFLQENIPDSRAETYWKESSNGWRGAKLSQIARGQFIFPVHGTKLFSLLGLILFRHVYLVIFLCYCQIISRHLHLLIVLSFLNPHLSNQ